MVLTNASFQLYMDQCAPPNLSTSIRKKLGATGEILGVDPFFFTIFVWIGDSLFIKTNKPCQQVVDLIENFVKDRATHMRDMPPHAHPSLSLACYNAGF